MTRDALQAAVATVYEAFASMPGPARLKGAERRDRSEIVEALTSSPLWRLSDDVIGAYAGWAITTVGAGQDFAYFLPRILELAVSNPVATGTEPAVIVQKLEMAEWTKWPEPRRKAVTNVFEAAFHAALDADPLTLPARSWLCGLVALHFDVDPLLAAWEKSGSPEAALQLAFFINELHIAADGDLTGAWWDDRPESARRAVARWISRPERVDALARAVGRFDEFEWEIELALMALKRWASAWAAARTGGGAAGED